MAIDNAIQRVAILPDFSFQSNAAVVTDATVWYPICLIMARGKRVVLNGVVGAGAALTDLKITRGIIQDDPNHQALAIGSNGDFANVDADIVDVVITPGNPAVYQTPASGVFQIEINANGAEFALYAKSAGATTLQIAGSVYPASVAHL